MRLKKMEITGFKSFVDRSAIQFPAGVSAIVGPNGCGKSNIVDALRWAMGEQSVKQLRGKSMEDVIFAGTDGRPALNMAEVSLTLANENGDAPEELRDFTEIMVTRRLFRSGESVFLVNKRPCRLKDIHNLFLGSGMGSRSYAVIGQGNIGAITDAGPEERRAYIEEAAGVTRYKNRKAEALRKLDATNANLVRVTDIIAEVERRMRGLRRQARKAERHKSYQEKIRDLDVRLSIHRYDGVGVEIERAREEIRSLKDGDLERAARLKRIDAAAEEIKLTRTQKNQQISTQRSKRYDTRRDADRTENDLAHLREEIGRLEGEIESLTGARTELSEKNRRIDDEVAETETETAAVRERIDGIGKDLDREREAAAGVKARSERLKQAVEAAERNLSDLSRREERYRSARRNAADNQENLDRRIKRADEAVALGRKSVEDLRAREVSAGETLAQRRRAAADLAGEIDRLEKETERAKAALAGQVKAVQQLEHDRDKIRSRHGALRKMAEEFEWFKDGVRAVMKRKEGADGVLGLMADVIDPQPEVETAVEAFLGEALQYVLVRDLPAGAEAAAYLRDKGAGRCGFIPVSRPGTGQLERAPRAPGSLLSRVAVKPGFEEVVDGFLGSVALTDDLSGAMAAHGGNGGGRPAVTRDGQVISPRGILIGGSGDNLAGILEKKRELKDLEAELGHLEHALSDGRAVLEGLEATVREADAALREHRDERREAAEAELAAQKAVFQVAEELKQARRHLEIVGEEQDRLLEEADGLSAEVERSDRALAALAGEVEEAKQRKEEKRGALSAVASETAAADQRIMDLQLRLTAEKGRLENGAAALKRLREFREDSAKRLEQLSRDIVLKERRLGETRTKITDQEHRLHVMYENLKHLESALEKSERDYQAMEDRLRENDAAAAEIRRAREESLDRLRTLELEQSQRELTRENIEARILERYGRPLAAFRSVHHGDAAVTVDTEALSAELADLREKLAGLGDVNMGAIQEYEEHKERFDFLDAQRADLVKAVEDLHQVIRKINRISQEKFLETFNQINGKLAEVFPRLFNGGTAQLVLTEPDKPLETGVEFMVHPPGKKLTRLSLLSGGEKALSAIAFVFSIFLIRPTSFCIMDEIDAPLDDANVHRFNELLRMIGEQSQIIMITHKKKSMEFADTLFGVTMEKKGISKVVSVNLTTE